MNHADGGHGHSHRHDHSHDHSGERDRHRHRHDAQDDHRHHAGHVHGDPGSRAFPVAVALNFAFVIVEFGYGFWANSTALMADAGHNLSDVLGLLLAWGAAVLSRRQPAGRYTYGLRSTSILAALGNAVLLLVACGAIALEAVQRLVQPAEVAGLTMTLVALAGIAVNGFSAWLFMAGKSADLNQRAAYLHLLGDAAVSLAVVLGGLGILFTGWTLLDPLLSLAIVAVIVAGSWGLLREAARLSVNAVPAHIDLEAVQAWLQAQQGVVEVLDLHIWGMSTTESALTATLVIPDAQADDAFLDQLELGLQQRFRIGHATIQIRRATPEKVCSLH